MVADHAGRLQEFRIGEPLQDAGDARLRRGVDRGLGAEIEPVERVKIRQLQQRDQLVADILRRLLAHVGNRGDRRRLAAEAQFGIERGVAQGRVDDPRLVQHAQVLVGQGGERVAIADQVIARPPLRQ